MVWLDNVHFAYGDKPVYRGLGIEVERGERIVLVACASAHREDAFAACQFLMDWLKTSAPFWKQEDTATGPRWVEADAKDDALAARWKTK